MNAELRRANDDLQQFAYSASHDLQEPIRNVSIYSEMVARRYQNVMDAEGRQFLEFLRQGGRRLANLVDDLLAYVRAGSLADASEMVDAAVVLGEVLADLAPAIRECDASITSGELPKVYLNKAHLRQLFQNLLSNALKYRNSVAPRIHVSATAEGAEWRFAVQDNGIGINPKYKETIFGVFKRLHESGKYSGTGIGLSICQRVVARYGGRIWVESDGQSGSTFLFTVPIAEPGSTGFSAAPAGGRQSCGCAAGEGSDRGSEPSDRSTSCEGR
jgi:light-regulated signal transduction histidine kinase (bacteriophytochrome)